jgi:fructokinase
MLMKTNRSQIAVVCFGEILWDNLPGGRRPGGAPMNVAYHLHRLGLESKLVSSVGHDGAGQELIDFLKSIGLETSYVQVNREQKTSEVQATVNPDNHEVTYEILAPVAWDFIGLDEALTSVVEDAQAFVYGTLSARNTVSRSTLNLLLEKSPYRIFDVNLRAPHHTKETIEQLLRPAHLAKLNKSELTLIAGWYNPNCRGEAECVEVLLNKFKLEEMLITKGGDGASYYSHTLRYDYPAYNIDVNDTIGSGDSFLAAFLAMKLRNEPLELMMDYSAAMGAFITSQAGACPPYSKSDFERFIWKKKLGIS